MGLYNVWLFKYYSDTERLSLNETNLGYIISMWVFLLSLPITAYLADNWKTPWGRRRQWMIFVAPIFFGITFLLFYVPPVPRFLVGSVAVAVSVPDKEDGFFQIALLALLEVLLFCLFLIFPKYQDPV